MEENKLEEYYNNYDEEGRLLRKYGQVEYITTMKYIHYLLTDKKKEQCRILEVGAGTGRYAVSLAREGYRIDAVELIQHNLDILKSKIQPLDPIEVKQGNALYLSCYKDEIFDMTLLLGPMYHLYTEEDKKKALREAIRVTKTGGYILVAYCMNEPTIIQFGFGKNLLRDYIKKDLISEDFHCRSKPEELFELVRTEDIKRLTKDLAVTRMNLIATDGATNYMRETIDDMDDELFELWIKYHLSICERQDLIGATHHSLDILRKG
jgi:ubiquinone/menaquinone biosynthesis C-methylase UbiE